MIWKKLHHIVASSVASLVHMHSYGILVKCIRHAFPKDLHSHTPFSTRTTNPMCNYTHPMCMSIVSQQILIVFLLLTTGIRQALCPAKATMYAVLLHPRRAQVAEMYGLSKPAFQPCLGCGAHLDLYSPAVRRERTREGSSSCCFPAWIARFDPLFSCQFGAKLS